MLPMRQRRTISLAKNPGSLVRFTFRGAHGENAWRGSAHVETRSALCTAAGAAIALALSEV